MKVIKHKDKWYLQSETGYKEILLSTDDSLIQDGVQAIDDEFLEWFVKNPSCEIVEVQKFYGLSEEYLIIIPTKEPKTKCYCGHTSYCDCIPLEPKQETLEEAAEKLTNDFPVLEVRFNMSNEEIYGWFLEALQKGAKWQQERMYSEEEVELIANEMVNWAIDNIGNPNPQSGKKFDEVLNKFKNKYKYKKRRYNGRI